MRSKSLINDIETIYDEVRHQLRVGYTLIQLWFVVCPTATRTDCRRCNRSVWTSRHVHVPGRQSDVHRDSVLYILQLLPNFPVFFFSQCLILEESPRCPAWFCKCPNLKKSGIVCCTSCCVSEKIVFALFEMKVQSVLFTEIFPWPIETVYRLTGVTSYRCFPRHGTSDQPCR